MKSWHGSKTKAYWRRKRLRTVTKEVETSPKACGVNGKSSSAAVQTAILVSEDSLTYGVLREVIQCHGVRWVLDMRQNPRLFKQHRPRWTGDPFSGIVGFLTPLGIRYRWLGEMARILASFNRSESVEWMGEEEFEHVQDFLRIFLTRKSRVLLIIPDGTRGPLDLWLAARLELVWHFDPMSVLAET